MLLRVPGVLTIDALAYCRAIVEHADRHDGKITAGLQSAQVKNNSQLPEVAPASREARALAVAGLAQSARFFSGALPKKTFPPLFNRDQGGANSFGEHVDNAVRTSAVTGARVTADLLATLFLSEPDEYEGGRLVIEDTFGPQRVELAAGELLPSQPAARIGWSRSPAACAWLLSSGSRAWCAAMSSVGFCSNWMPPSPPCARSKATPMKSCA